MAGVSNRLSAGVFVLLLLFSTSSSLFTHGSDERNEVTTFNPDWVRFEVSDDVYREAVGVMDDGLTERSEAVVAFRPGGAGGGFTLMRVRRF